jgi:DNA-binding MarR family transcriptional regulator
MVAVRKVRGRETNRPGQISFAQYGLLHGLAGECERSARDLAEHADLSPATVTQMLEHLEAAGLVTRTRSEQDRRVVLSVLTERGAVAEFSESELAVASRVLNRLADYFDEMLVEPVEA